MIDDYLDTTPQGQNTIKKIVNDMEMRKDFILSENYYNRSRVYDRDGNFLIWIQEMILQVLKEKVIFLQM